MGKKAKINDILVTCEQTLVMYENNRIQIRQKINATTTKFILQNFIIHIAIFEWWQCSIIILVAITQN